MATMYPHASVPASPAARPRPTLCPKCPHRLSDLHTHDFGDMKTTFKLKTTKIDIKTTTSPSTHATDVPAKKFVLTKRAAKKQIVWRRNEKDGSWEGTMGVGNEGLRETKSSLRGNGKWVRRLDDWARIGTCTEAWLVGRKTLECENVVNHPDSMS